MHVAILRGIIPAPLGIGAIGMTLHLTNQEKVVLDALSTLEIEEKPEIPEDEMTPTPKPIPPPPPPQSQQQTPNQDTNDDDEKEDEDNDNTDDDAGTTSDDPSATTDDSQSSDSDSSDSGTSEAEDPEVIVKRIIMTIDSKHKSWINSPGSLTSGYEVLTNVEKLLQALQSMQKVQGTPAAS